MSELRVQFGRRLRQLHRQKDLTQEQLAEAAGISMHMLSNIIGSTFVIFSRSFPVWFSCHYYLSRGYEIWDDRRASKPQGGARGRV